MHFAPVGITVGTGDGLCVGGAVGGVGAGEGCRVPSIRIRSKVWDTPPEIQKNDTNFIHHKNPLYFLLYLSAWVHACVNGWFAIDMLP
jgi:hypothetical protein